MLNKPKYLDSGKHYYYHDNYFEYPIGRVLEYFTNLMLEKGIKFEKINVDDFGYDVYNKFRTHFKIYPYKNHIRIDNSMDYQNNIYIIEFHFDNVLLQEEKKYITSLFYNDDNYYKSYIYYFYLSNSTNIIKIDLNKFWNSEFRKNKINRLLNG